MFDNVYTLASANIDQSVPNLATIYIPIKSRMSSIMGQIESEHTSYLPLNLEKLLNLFVYILATANVDQLLSSTKHGLNVCDCKILKEFNYYSDRDRMVRVICPLLKKKKKCYIWLFTQSLSSANIDQSAPNLVQICPTEFEWIWSWVWLDRTNWSYLLLNWEKLLHSTLYTLKHLQI